VLNVLVWGKGECLKKTFESLKGKINVLIRQWWRWCQWWLTGAQKVKSARANCNVPLDTERVIWEKSLSTSIRFRPPRLLQLAVVWRVGRRHAEASVNPERRGTAHRRRQTIWSHHARAAPVALATCPVTSGVQSHMSSTLVVVWSPTGIRSWWRQPCRWHGRCLLRSAADRNNTVKAKS